LELTPDLLPPLLEAGHAVALGEPGGPLTALALLGEDQEDQELHIGFADGDPAAVHALAMALRVYAGRHGATRAHAWLPEVDWLREAFASAGYAFGEWQGEMCLYERRFPHYDPLPEGEGDGDGHAG